MGGTGPTDVLAFPIDETADARAVAGRARAPAEPRRLATAAVAAGRRRDLPVGGRTARAPGSYPTCRHVRGRDGSAGGARRSARARTRPRHPEGQASMRALERRPPRLFRPADARTRTWPGWLAGTVGAIAGRLAAGAHRVPRWISDPRSWRRHRVSSSCSSSSSSCWPWPDVAALGETTYTGLAGEGAERATVLVAAARPGAGARTPCCCCCWPANAGRRRSSPSLSAALRAAGGVAIVFVVGLALIFPLARRLAIERNDRTALWAQTGRRWRDRHVWPLRALAGAIGAWPTRLVPRAARPRTERVRRRSFSPGRGGRRDGR